MPLPSQRRWLVMRVLIPIALVAAIGWHRHQGEETKRQELYRNAFAAIQMDYQQQLALLAARDAVTAEPPEADDIEVPSLRGPVWAAWWARRGALDAYKKAGIGNQTTGDAGALATYQQRLSQAAWLAFVDEGNDPASPARTEIRTFLAQSYEQAIHPSQP